MPQRTLVNLPNFMSKFLVIIPKSVTLFPIPSNPLSLFGSAKLQVFPQTTKHNYKKK